MAGGIKWTTLTAQELDDVELTSWRMLRVDEEYSDLLVRIHFIIVMIRWTGLALGSLNFLSQVALHLPS